MTTKLVGGLAVALLAAVATTEVNAATYNYSTSVALTQSSITGGEYLQLIGGSPSFTLQAGDQITGAINFNNGSLTINGNVNWLDFDFFGNAQTDFTANVTLLGVTGTLGGTNPRNFGPAFGNQVVGADFGPISSPSENVSFTGISYTINIVGITDNSNNPISAPFDFARIDINTNSVQFNSETPLPAALPLFATSLGVMGLLARRRKRKAAAALAA